MQTSHEILLKVTVWIRGHTWARILLRKFMDVPPFWPSMSSYFRLPWPLLCFHCMQCLPTRWDVVPRSLILRSVYVYTDAQFGVGWEYCGLRTSAQATPWLWDNSRRSWSSVPWLLRDFQLSRRRHTCPIHPRGAGSFERGASSSRPAAGSRRTAAAAGRRCTHCSLNCAYYMILMQGFSSRGVQALPNTTRVVLFIFIRCKAFSVWRQIFVYIRVYRIFFFLI